MKALMTPLLTLAGAGLLLGGATGCSGKGDDTGGGGPSPELATSHEAMDFGLQPYGVASGMSLTIANVGADTLTLDSVAVTDPWSIEDEVPGSLEAGESAGLTIAFVADNRGTNEGEVVIRSNDPTRPELVIPLSADVDTPPELTLFLDPPEAFTDTVLEAAVNVSGDSTYLDLGYSWQVDGSVISGAADSQLDGVTHFNKHQTVRVTVTPLVGVVYLDSLSTEITIDNTPPEAPEVAWSSLTPDPGVDDLQCVIDEEAYDADPEDADSLVYSFVFQVDGVDYTDAVATDRPGDTIPAEDLGRSQEWTCTVTAIDGDGAETEPVTVALETGGAPP